MRALRERGIGTQVHYVPVPWQPYWRSRQAIPALPGAEHYYARTLSLPLYPGMDDGDPPRVVTALTEVLGLG
jgi:dTDP-4-amino-4,6-dideoxygalactose transaminase